MAGRSSVDVEDVVGYFINPVVVRADVNGYEAYSTFLEQVSYFHLSN